MKSEQLYVCITIAVFRQGASVNTKKISSVLAILAVLLSVCGGCRSARPEKPRDGELAGTFWKPVGSPQFAYIEFIGDGRMVGSTGGNRFFGPVAYAKGKRLRLGPLAATRIPGADRKFEESFFARIEETRGYVLDGDKLTLYNEERQPVMELYRLKPQKGGDHHE